MNRGVHADTAAIYTLYRVREAPAPAKGIVKTNNKIQTAERRNRRQRQYCMHSLLCINRGDSWLGSLLLSLREPSSSAIVHANYG